MAAVALENIRLTMEAIRSRSPLLAKMDDDNDIDIVGGMYCVESGEVEFVLGPPSAVAPQGEKPSV